MEKPRRNYSLLKTLTGIRMNLKPRFLLLASLLFISSALAVSVSVRTLAEGIVEEWASRLLVKQTLYDKNRTLQPILQELALARQLAQSRLLIDWANNQDSPSAKNKALIEAESYRHNFREHSYFIAFLDSGHYFHNNAKNEFAGKEYIYTLDPKKKADSWFYDLIEDQRDIHININPDEALGITKLWIDVLIRDGDKILGIVGTGLDLTLFLENIIGKNDPGITSFFIDHDGAIQLHRNAAFIDFASISKKNETQNTIDLLFDKEDVDSIYEKMHELEKTGETVATLFAGILGQRKLLGIAYLPEIDWYEVTVIDLKKILPLSRFSTILFVSLIALFITLALFNLALNRFVLNPLCRLDKAIVQFEKNKSIDPHLTKTPQNEIGRLIGHYQQMTTKVVDSQQDLERKVQERTIALERLSQTDSLTGLFNRRGMTEKMEHALQRADRNEGSMGLLLIDLDSFKNINDVYGHGIGDEVLEAVAKIINKTIRPYDCAARWGGDEFLILLQPTDKEKLSLLAERLRSDISSRRFTTAKLSVSISIGGCISTKDINSTQLLNNADKALYEAKGAGRNRFSLHNSV